MEVSIIILASIIAAVSPTNVEVVESKVSYETVEGNAFLEYPASRATNNVGGQLYYGQYQGETMA